MDDQAREEAPRGEAASSAAAVTMGATLGAAPSSAPKPPSTRARRALAGARDFFAWMTEHYGRMDPRTAGLFRIVLGLLCSADLVRHWAVGARLLLERRHPHQPLAPVQAVERLQLQPLPRVLEPRRGARRLRPRAVLPPVPDGGLALAALRRALVHRGDQPRQPPGDGRERRLRRRQPGDALRLLPPHRAALLGRRAAPLVPRADGGDGRRSRRPLPARAGPPKTTSRSPSSSSCSTWRWSTSSTSSTSAARSGARARPFTTCSTSTGW